MGSPTRDTLENLADRWRARLQEAELHYQSASAYYRSQLHRPPADLNGDLAAAREVESKALAEYRRVLRIFIDLTVDGKLPDESPRTSRDAI